MKKINKLLGSLILISFFAFISCQKQDLAGEDTTTTALEEDVTNVKPDLVSETYKFGKTIEDLNFAKRPTTLNTFTSWNQITKNEVRDVGIDDSDVFDIIEDQYPYNPSHFNYDEVLSVSLNDSESYGPNYWSNISNPNTSDPDLPEYRFYGTGDVSQNNDFTPWQPVQNVSAEVITNYLDEPQLLDRELWFTTTRSVSREFTIEASTTVSIEASIEIPFVADIGGSISTTLGVSSTVADEKEFNRDFYKPAIEIPVGQSVRFVLEERTVPVETEWKFPIQFRGNYVVGRGVGNFGVPYFVNVQKVNVNAFDDEYDQPDKYHTVLVTEYLSHEFRIGAYIINNQ